ncbi:putative E3 ubiquitin ligase [Handroanthus impetiginosus]|uniref:Putative E3 ubiquitin ligase n=1 Tax=Handroanthus impetiginosus TaxID=429701 RepID=A0A2G9IAY4_9LAMI|nr:putative E3 ubiquitin ligase [Handroanthus impetiginosus]
MNSDNRKMKEIIATAYHPTLAAAAQQGNLFNLHSACPSTGRHSQVKQILNNPLSYASLLTFIDQADYNSVPTDIKDQIEDIKRTNAIHVITVNLQLNERVRRELEGLMGKTAMRLKEKEVELQQKVAENAELERVMMHYRTEVERLQMTVRCLEQVVNVQARLGLQEGTATSQCSETGKEDEQIFMAVRLDCRNCKREMATVMLWPCRHVCLCRRCDADLRVMFCPVCCLLKNGSLEVFLPPSEY